jgi:nicotinamide/nicotinate riboside kinase
MTGYSNRASAKKSAITIIIGLSGPSSSGKTTLARLLRSIIADEKRVRTFIIHEDDFYHPDDKYERQKKKRKRERENG